MMAPVTRALFASCGLVTAAVAILWHTGDKSWTPPQARAVDASLFAVPKISRELSNGETFAEISARPLFDPSRRPPPPEPVAEAATEPDPFVDVKLLGLFGSAGEGGVILQIEGRSKRLRVGETLGPWTLRGTNGGSAHFVGPAGRKKLDMRYLPQPAAAATPVTGGAAALPAGGKGEADTAVQGQAQEPAAQGAESADQATSLATRAAERRAAVRARRQQIMNSNQ